MGSRREKEGSVQYTYNANALALGGVLTKPHRRVIPSIASVSLAPSGGFGIATERNYDKDGIHFDLAESRVFGDSPRRGLYVTRAETLLTNLNLFDKIAAASIWTQIITERELADDGTVLDHRFTFEAQFIGLEVNGERLNTEIESSLCSGTYEQYCDVLLSDDEKLQLANDAARGMADFAQRHGLRRLSGESIDVSADQEAILAPLARTEPAVVAGARPKPRLPHFQGPFEVPTLRKTLFKDPASAERRIVGFGKASFAELLVKPGRRRLTMFRIELAPGAAVVPKDDGFQSPGMTKAMMLMDGGGDNAGGGDGGVSGGSVDGNGSPTYP